MDRVAAHLTRSIVADRARRRAPERPDPPGTAARRSALKLLDAVDRRGEALDRAVGAACTGLSPADRALAVAIAAEVLRHRAALDAQIDSVTPQPLPSDAKARVVLELALVQHHVLGTPAHAVVATALPLVAGGPRRLVHGVLSRLLREGDTLPRPPALPADVADRWTTAWGNDVVAAAEQAWDEAPPLDLTLGDPDSPPPADAVSLMPGHARLPRGRAVTDIPGFAEGAWWVQDLAASLPARLLGPGDGRRALDLCAAPGGKTMQLVAAGWRVAALDQSAKRMGRLSANLTRTNLAADTIVANALEWQAPEPYDAVLLDAPCSATGIFRRHPDVLHRVTRDQIVTLTELQRALLHRAADWVAPGGALVYATCSLEPVEGEEQITAFLSAHPEWRIVPPEPDALPTGVPVHASGWVRTLPGMLASSGGLDGFFMARLRRT